MGTAVNTYVLTIEDEQYPVTPGNPDAERLLQSRLAEAQDLPARVSLRDGGDTEGHQLAEVVAIDLGIGDDVEGHAFTLRFPSAEAARDFEKRFATTGILLGVLAAGAVGIGAGQALSQAAVRTDVAPIVTTTATRDMDKNLAPVVEAAPRDMDKNLAPVVEAAPRDMDKNLAPAVEAAPRDMDKNLAPVQDSAPTSHRGAIPE